MRKKNSLIILNLGDEKMLFLVILAVYLVFKWLKYYKVPENFPPGDTFINFLKWEGFPNF